MKVTMPTLVQFGVLVAYGAIQMAAPYWLLCRGLLGEQTPDKV